MVLQAFRRANVASLDSTSTLNDIKLAVEASGLGSAEEVLLYMLKHGEGTRLTKMLRHCRQMKNLEEREAATHAQLVELAETPTPTQLVGDKKVAELRAVVCGIVKSEGTTLEDSLERLIGLRRVFADLHVVLYSHDCSKDVRDLIQDFRRQHPGAVTFLEDTNLPPERSAGLPSDARLRIDALGRNRLLLEALTTHGDCDLLLMCDISEVLSRFHAGMIEDCLSAHPTGSWDMLTANTYAVAPPRAHCTPPSPSLHCAALSCRGSCVRRLSPRAPPPRRNTTTSPRCAPTPTPCGASPCSQTAGPRCGARARASPRTRCSTTSGGTSRPSPREARRSRSTLRSVGWPSLSSRSAAGARTRHAAA